jgi:hypothetical protein
MYIYIYIYTFADINERNKPLVPYINVVLTKERSTNLSFSELQRKKKERRLFPHKTMDGSIFGVDNDDKNSLLER